MKLNDIRILTEALLDVDEIVEYIYNDSFKEFIDAVQKWKRDGGSIQKVPSIKEKEYNFDKSNPINNIKFRQAMDLNPIVIKTSASETSFYNPMGNFITISFSSSAYDIVLDTVNSGGTYVNLLRYIDNSRLKAFENEMNGSKVKASIAHEISHWMNDSLNNFYLSRLVKKAGEASGNGRHILTLGKPNVNMTTFEIDAVVHGIAQLKKHIGNDVWDLLTIKDLFDNDPTLNVVMNQIKKGLSRKDLQTYTKDIIKRLNREKLLGKEMSGRFIL